MADPFLSFIADLFPTDTFRSERRWREPRKNTDCYRSGYWHSWTASATEIEVIEMIVGMVRGLQPDLVLETGTYYGLTASFIGQAIKRNGHGRLVTIETRHRCYEHSRLRCEGLPVECIHGSSLKYRFPDKTRLDLAFFDSEWGARENEYSHFKPWMHHHTVILWHDAGTQEKSIRPHVLDLVNRGEVTATFLPTSRGLCIARPNL